MRTLLALLLLLPACIIDPGDQSYYIDGVRVVVEDHRGPKKPAMVYTVNVFREAFKKDYLELEDTVELELWQSIELIHWTIDVIGNGGAHYNPVTSTLKAVWLGCALDVPLYRALMLAYVPDADELDMLWAEDLETWSYKDVCSHVMETQISLPF